MLNAFVGIGRLGRDARISTTRNGDPVAHFAIAIDRRTRPGKESNPDWIPCALFGDRANMLGPYLNKGLMVGIRGRLETWRNGGGEDRFSVVVDEINFLRRPARTEDGRLKEEVPA